MAEELSIISSNLLTNVSESEVNELINQMVEKSKNNMEEICELTLECTTLLSSAESRSTALSNQGVFKRLIGSITGKNHKLYVVTQIVIWRELAMTRALAMMSGGLDSTLAAKLVKDQGIEVIVICFKSYFFGEESAKKMCEQIDIKLEVVDFDQSILPPPSNVTGIRASDPLLLKKLKMPRRRAINSGANSAS